MVNKKEIICYNTDASRLTGEANQVIFPKTIEEVQHIIRTSDIDIVPRGGGTNLVGGAIPDSSIVVDMNKLNQVSKFNPIRKTVRVGAGTTIKELNEKLNPLGFEFPIQSFNSVSTIGGMIALNVPGFRTMKYGGIKEWIEEIEFVNSKGELIKTNKADLMDICGMGGITGIIVGATLKIIPKVKRSASIFQSNNLEEIFNIARRLKLEKEVTTLEFFSPVVSKLLGLPEKYHIVIEFDSERGKIKGKEYTTISQFKEKAYEVLYSEGYYNSEDPKLFFDKIKEFVSFLQINQIPYICYLGAGIVHPFFKDNEKGKMKEIISFIEKANAKLGMYGVGLKRKDRVDSFEKKIIQRVKLRYDPHNRFNKGKVLDLDDSVKYETTPHKIPHLKSIDQEEAEELMPLLAENKEGSETEEESETENKIKTPEEEMEEFIEKVEIMEKIAEKEKVIEQSKALLMEKAENIPGLDQETKERIRDYEETFDSELVDERKKQVEDFARNIGRQRPLMGIEEVKKQREHNAEYNSIQNIMTNSYKKPIAESGVNKSENISERKSAPVDYRSIQDIMTNNRKKEPREESKVAENIQDNKSKTSSAEEKELIKKIMEEKFGLKDKKEVSEENSRKY